MWLKINRPTIPISVKLTLLYTAILFCILLFTSILTVAGSYYILYTQAETDIMVSSDSIIQYLAAGKPINDHLLHENILVPGVTLRISDDQKNLLLDSAPYLPNNDSLAEEIQEEGKLVRLTLLLDASLQIFHMNHTYFYYTNQQAWQGDHSYQIQLMKTMTEQKYFLKILIKSLFITNLLGILIAILAGIFISRKTLHPIRAITATAKEIEINDLGKRIAISSSKDDLHELATTFNHMLNRIQAGFEQQRRFVADASHELRTPITVISGYANMLDRWGKQDPSVLTEGIDAIKSEAASMYNLIEKLLFLARADQKKQVLKKAPLAMEGLLEDIIQETRLIAPQHQILLQKNDSVSIYADAGAIKQMLRIFIENSIKYTPIAGTITIASRKAETHLEVIIEDTGIGIPEKDQEKIFDRFYRVDSSRSKITGGTGLGLSIARWIASQHDTTIKLTSISGQGTRILLQIPLSNTFP